jgi:hypothetical protein
MQRVESPKRPRDSRGLEIHKEALINIKVGILKKNYPEKSLQRMKKHLILEEFGRFV